MHVYLRLDLDLQNVLQILGVELNFPQIQKKEKNIPVQQIS